MGSGILPEERGHRQVRRHGRESAELLRIHAHARGGERRDGGFQEHHRAHPGGARIRFFVFVLPPIIMIIIIIIILPSFFLSWISHMSPFLL
jgi:hypothetical protein